MTTKNLGLVQAIHSGTTAPNNTKMLWYDENSSILKIYNNPTTVWERLPFGSEVDFLASIVANLANNSTENLDQGSYQGEVTISSDPSVLGLDIEYVGNWVMTNDTGEFTNFLNGYAQPINLTDGSVYIFTYVEGGYWEEKLVPTNDGDPSLFLGIIKSTDSAPASPVDGNWGIAQGTGIYTNFDNLQVNEGVETYIKYDLGTTSWYKEEKSYQQPNFLGVATPSTTPKNNPRNGEYYIIGEDGDYINFFGTSVTLKRNNQLSRIEWNGTQWNRNLISVVIDNIIRPESTTSTSVNEIIFNSILETDKKIIISEIWDFGGATIDFTSYPNMVIEVEKGGMLKNVTLICNDTWFVPKSHQIFDTVTFEGTPRAEYVTPEMFGAVGYLTEEESRLGTDSFAAFQGALDFVSGRNLVLKAQKFYYRITQLLHGYDFELQGNNVKLVATDNTVKRLLYIAPYLDRDDTIYSGSRYGPTWEDSVPLITDAIHSETFAKVVDGSVFKEGDIVLLSSDQNYTDGAAETGGYKRGELKEVKSSIDNVITFTSPIFENGYVASESATLKKMIQPVTAVIKDVELIGEGDDVPDAGTWLGASTGHGILTAFTKYLYINNLKITNCISSGITQMYSYNTIIENYNIDGCLGGRDNGGYAHELVGACTSPKVINYNSYGSRHAVDISDSSFTTGRVWDAQYINCYFTGNELYSGSIVGFHTGGGSIKFINTFVEGSATGEVANKTQDWYAGETREYADAVINKKRFYLSLVGDEITPNNAEVSDTDSWLLIHSPNAYLDIEYDPEKTDYVFDNKIYYRGEYFLYNSITSVAGTDPYDSKYWRPILGAADGCCYTFRGPVRKIELYNCGAANTDHGFIFEGADELIIDTMYFKNINAIFTSPMFNRSNFKNWTVYRSGLFAWHDSTTALSGLRELIFKNSTFREFNYGSYGYAYIHDCFTKIIFESCDFIDAEVTGWDYHTEGQCPRFYLFDGNTTFEGIEFNNCNFLNQGFLSPYVHGDADDPSYYVRMKSCTYKNPREINYCHGFGCSRPATFILKDCDFDLTHSSLLLSSTLVDTCSGVTGVSEFAIYNSKIVVDQIRTTAANIAKMLLINSTLEVGNENTTPEIKIYGGDLDSPSIIEGSFGDPNSNVDAIFDAEYKDYSYIGTWKKTTALGTLTGWVLQPKTNYTATAAPTVNDDETLGYGVGSRWYDTVLLKAYELFDNTTGAAVWVPLN